MFIELAFDNLIGSGADGVSQALVEEAEIAVGLSGRLLDHGDGPDQGFRHDILADPEIPARALGLRAPIGFVRNLDLPETVAFDARGGWGPAFGTPFLRHAQISCRWLSGYAITRRGGENVPVRVRCGLLEGSAQSSRLIFRDLGVRTAIG